MRVALYYSLLLAVVGYAFARGGRPEKWGAIIMLVGSIAGHLAWSSGPRRLVGLEVAELYVDLAALAAFFVLALTSRRNWTLWIAAFQLVGTLAHAARLMDPTMMPTGYAFLIVVWSYPMLLMIALGTRAHSRRKAAASI